MSHSKQGVQQHALAALTLICLMAAPHAAFSADKPKEQQISHTIGKEVEAAQKAMKASQWSDVIKNLEVAETKSGLTPFDKKSIYDFKAYAYIKLNNYKAAEDAWEKAMDSGGYTPAEKAETTERLFKLATQNQQYAKALEYGKTVTESGNAKPDDFVIMTQVYYTQKDCKSAVQWSDKAVAAAKKAGEAPKEVLLQIKLQCASDASDSPGQLTALYDLVRLTNSTKYWNTLIRIERQDERDDHNLLMIYRVMYDVGAMQADTDFIEMAQLLGDAALPGEAASVIDKAMSTPGVMKDEHKERTNRLLASLKTRADKDKQGIASFEAEAQKSPSGQLGVKLGEVHYGFGEYPAAVTAINAALAKGQIKNMDEAYVYLGRSQVAQKNNADAKKAFQQLKSAPGVSPRVLKLWELYSEKLGS
jgi:tetratricopeptide (TPR) repeat protein